VKEPIICEVSYKPLVLQKKLIYKLLTDVLSTSDVIYRRMRRKEYYGRWKWIGGRKSEDRGLFKRYVSQYLRGRT